MDEADFKSIYYNAWEDDFCDDPLAAIISQLSNHFTDDQFTEKIDRIKSKAGPLLARVPFGLLQKHTGVDLSGLLDAWGTDALQSYEIKKALKDDLRLQLTNLAEQVYVQSNSKPMVFIIDELDRCRPTFAIELLERVKHIFDIPNMVFVFGLNRDELCSSIKSVYGDINADVYLRRFFDIEFQLLECEPAAFCNHLIYKYNLETFFNAHRLSTDQFRSFFGILSRCFNFSLRDIEHCIQSVAFLSKTVEPNDYLLAHLVSLLITLRLKNNDLYHRFCNGYLHASDVMDYIDESFEVIRPDDETEQRSSRDATERVLNQLEVRLYFADHSGRCLNDLRVLQEELSQQESPTQESSNQGNNSTNSPEHHHRVKRLSKRTRDSGVSRVNELVDIADQNSRGVWGSDFLAHIYNKIELHVPMLER